MGRNKKSMPREAGERKRSDATLFAVFAGVTLIVGLFFLVVCAITIRGVAAAQNWDAVPCVIETCEYVVYDDIQSLNFVYRYTYAGNEYRSDRLDMIPGSMGDDGPWETAIFDRYPVGSEAVCYVAPNSPANSVFDRQHGSDSIRTLWLLSFPFLCIGVGFSIAFTKKVISDRMNSATRPNDSPIDVPTVPRRISPTSKLLMLVAGPGRSNSVWLFIVGFTFVFVMFRGPSALEDAWKVLPREQLTSGQVTGVEKLTHSEWSEPLFEYEFSFQVGDSSHRGSSATLGKQYVLDDTVEIAFNAEQIEHAIIVGARPSGFPRWIGVWALVVVGVLVLFYLRAFAQNWRALYLLQNGVAVVVRQPSDREISQGNCTQSYEVDGKTHQIGFTAVGAADELTALYDPKCPRRYLVLNGLEHHLKPDVAMLPFIDNLIDLSIPPLSLFAIYLLL